MSFDFPTDIPVYDVEVLIDDNGKPLETEVPSCTISCPDIMDYRCSTLYLKIPTEYFSLPPTI